MMESGRLPIINHQSLDHEWFISFKFQIVNASVI